nr:ribosomal protein S3 [Lithothamnion corallioides]
MSQKINPISNKLGTSQTWNITFSKYGKNFKCYNKFLYKQFKVLFYIHYLLKKKGFFLDNVKIYFTNRNVFINIFIFNLNSISTLSKTNYLLKVISYWLMIPITLNFYRKFSLTNSAFLLSNYVLSLVIQGISPKKLLQNVYIILKEQVTKSKLVYTTQGIKKIILKGFKLKFSGCFEMSRNQMAKTVQCNFGSLPLTKLNGYIEYSNNTLYTKFGSCGLKIWLFYEFKSL